MFQFHAILTTMLTLIDVDGREHQVRADGGYVHAEDLTAATGWTLKPVGLCRDEVCLPLFGRQVAHPDDPDRIDLDAWADVVGVVTARDAQYDVVALAPSAQTRLQELRDGKAPSLRLNDVDGNPVSFDDFSGSKRVLVTWASWCGCRHELAGWQQL